MKNKLLKILSIGILSFSLLQTNANAITESESNKIINEFMLQAPQIVKDNLIGVSIKIQNDKEFNEEGYEYGIYKNDGTAGYRGVLKRKDNSSIIRINIDTDKAREGYMIDTFFHECFHEIDSYFSRSARCWKVKYSDKQNFINLYNEYKNNDNIGTYYLSSSREFFAQCGMIYVLYPQFLEKEYPKIYDYMDNLVKNYKPKYI